MFSSTLPSDEEFHAFWQNALTRLRGQKAPTDLREKRMAEYLEKNVLDVSGNLIRASWTFGLGIVPLGFTTYAPNAIEVQHRILKGLLTPGYERRDVASLMVEVCSSLGSRLDAGAYSELVNKLAEPPASLKRATRKRVGDATSPESPCEKVKATRLDRGKIIAHFHSHGARGTFIAAPCKKELRTGDVATHIYVLPKFALRLAKEKPREMQAALDLGLSATASDVLEACRHPRTGVYCLNHHQHLRRSYAIVYVTEEKRVLDSHADFLVAGGFSEHQLFVEALVAGEDFLSPLCKGPGTRPAGKGSKRKRQESKSERTRAMLAPPEPPEGWEEPKTAHLLLRPLRVITDIAGQGVIEFFPPNSIAPTAWGPPLVLAYYLKGRHYEATQPQEVAR